VKDRVVKVVGKVAHEVGHQIVEHQDVIIGKVADIVIDVVAPNVPFVNVVVSVAKMIIEEI
jgi:hypothetical protein